MLKKFENQVALITGGADGLGKGIAKRIASEGCKVVLFDVNGELLEETVAAFQAEGYAAEGFCGDITNEQSVNGCIDSIMGKHNRLDIAVNAAGIVGPTSTKITAYPVDAFDKVYAVNLRGSFLVTKYAISAMLPRNYGRILLIASIAGKEGNPFMAGYSATKAGVIGLVKGVAKEFAETGITVNGLAPAVIKTAMNEKTAPEQLAYMASKIPMGRLGTVEEVASLSSWIVSPESSFNTGFVFDISGGRATY